MVSFTDVLTTPGIPEPMTMKGQVAAHQLQTSSSSSVLVPLPPLSPVPRSSAIPIPLSPVPSRTPSPIPPHPPATEEVDQGLQSMIDSLVDLGNEVKTAFEEVFPNLRLEKSFRTTTTTASTGGRPSSKAILEHLAAKECEVEYFNAFRVLPEDTRDSDSLESAAGSERIGSLESVRKSDLDESKVSSESSEGLPLPPTAPPTPTTRIDSTYLFDRWKNGEDAGVLSDSLELSSVWKLSVEERRARVVGWERVIAGTTDPIDGTCSLVADTNGATDAKVDANENDAGAINDTSTDDVTDAHMSGEDDNIDMDAISRLCNAGRQYDVYQEILRLRDKDAEFPSLGDKRVIGATKQNLSEIRDLTSDNDMPEVVIVLGADSFLECELLVGLGGKTKHLIMFGDIPTKKPTISLPRLTAEFKKGHNLDVSLFERLIQNRYPCHTLRTIHTANTSAEVPPTNADVNNAWGVGVQTWGSVPPEQPPLGPCSGWYSDPYPERHDHKSSCSTVSAISRPIEESKAHKELQSLIGLAEVKATVDSLVKLVQVNTERQLKGKKPVQVTLNRVFLGPPGTGKTTVAKIYVKLLNEMGLLSTGGVVIKNANDFIEQYIGQSEANTKAILASAKGKVLIIDEAHTLNPTASNGADAHKKDVVDSLVSGVHNVPGDDQCVLLLGYEDEMIEMFRNANPGLDRRFRVSDAFYFPDFTTDELMQIFDAKLKKEELFASPAARKVASEMLDRARHRPNFRNGGAVDNMISSAKENYYGRFEVANFPDDVVFEPQDFDPDYDRGGGGSERLAALFEELVGCEDIMAKFEEYQIVSRTMRKCGKDARKVIPMNFVFKGPPGTGKTTIARKMGHIFYDIGFLASAEVVECSATDMIGSYLGQTGPKTQALFKKALGKVLFIDEAYRLCHGEYAQEAIGELVTLLTTKTYHMKMVVVLAGYDRDMDLLLLRNRGLASRFPEEIVFKDIEPDACLEILSRLLEKSGVRM